MRIARAQISNFRGISKGRVDFDGNTLLVGGNSIGKSTICEALDLVLGPERMYRRPVVDEYDFHGAKYQPYTETGGAGHEPSAETDVPEPTPPAPQTPDSADAGSGGGVVTPEIEIEVVLVDLSPSSVARFASYLRKWSVDDRDFADADPDSIDEADTHPWCLPLLFIGRFDPAEDDFEGNTFFAHPAPVVDDLSPESTELGGGRRIFGRDDKRHCGYLYLRTNRTGSRALSFQRGSLLDTVVRLEDQATGELWERARVAFADLDLREQSKLDTVLDEVQDRVAKFMAIHPEGVHVHPSDLTRESIRETLRIFITALPGEHAVPFNRLSTGSLNLLVFAMLTYIAELKGDNSVIFAMEEPEIALPPHAQRRLVDFVTSRMGQAIVTSHSPYVIERFEPDDIVMLARGTDGVLTSARLDLSGLMKPKKFREERRQFAEAILGRGVLVVEGATEASVLPVVADTMDGDQSQPYTHLDLSGISIYNAGNDASVPPLAPLFKALGKRAYGLHDTPTAPLTPAQAQQAKAFDHYLEAPYNGIEELLIAEMPDRPKRAFLSTAASLPDYPKNHGYLAGGASTADVDDLLKKVLKDRKGAYYGYAALLVGEAIDVTELPATYVKFLLDINADMDGSAVVAPPTAAGPAQAATAGPASAPVVPTVPVPPPTGTGQPEQQEPSNPADPQ